MNNINIINNEIEILNDIGDKFIIHFAGSDLYWTMVTYHKNNLFIINEEYGLFYELIDMLFKKYNINNFEWLSEAYGLEEEAHRLIIEKINDEYYISFIQNELNRFRIKGMCPICFCLSGSRNQEIINYFAKIYFDLINNNFKKKPEK